MPVAWLLTLPAAALIGGLAALLAGTGAAGSVILLLLVAGSGIWLVSRRNRIRRQRQREPPRSWC